MESPKRTCGECQACCTAMAIYETGTRPGVGTYLFLKKAGQTCKYAQQGRCAIYHQPHKPVGCRTFECFWLVGFGREEDRPDRSGVVFSLESHSAVHADGTPMESHDSSLIAYETRPQAARTDAMIAMTHAILNGWPDADQVRYLRIAPPGVRDPRMQLDRLTGQQAIVLVHPSEPSGHPREPMDADQERQYLDLVLGPGASERPSIGMGELLEAIRREVEHVQERQADRAGVSDAAAAGADGAVLRRGTAEPGSD